MKKLLLTMGVVLFLFSGIMAQNRQRPEQEKISVADRVERMAKTLELNDKQKADLTALFTETDKKRAEQKSEKREDFKAQREDMNAKLKSILGDEKFEKWQNSHKRPQRNDTPQGRNK